ncbi:MAG: biotin transporter BioY [Gemmatimonadetes bacterium]|nr:biotin transporter BioY [Gemmatimonadota bacterium]
MSRNVRLATASLMAALTAVSAYINIPIGPVPITMQTFFVLLSGAVLGGRWGAGSQAVYVCLGLAGIPVFAGGMTGPAVVLSPTFGYLVGFVLCAFLTGSYLDRFTRSSIPHLVAGMLLGHVAIFGCGLLYLYAYFNYYAGVETTWPATLAVGLIPFLPFGLVKLVLAVSVGRTLSKYVRLESP